MTAIATQGALQGVRELLNANLPRIQSALQNKIPPEYFCMVAINCIQKTPKLLTCTKESLIGALLEAAQLQLVPDGVLGQAYLVPYKTTVVFIPGYKGLRELALRTGAYTDIRARVVHENDEFNFKYGAGEFVHHVPAEKDRGEFRAVYAVADMGNATGPIEVLFKEEVEAHKEQYSPSWNRDDSAWQTAPARMWEKTAIRKLAGRLKMSVNIQTIMAREDLMLAGRDIDTGKLIDIPLVPDENQENAMDALTANLEKKNAESSGAVDIPISSPVQKEKEAVIKYLNKFSPNNMKKQLEKLKYFCDGADPDFNAEKVKGVEDLSDEMIRQVSFLMEN